MSELVYYNILYVKRITLYLYGGGISTKYMMYSNRTYYTPKWQNTPDIYYARIYKYILQKHTIRSKYPFKYTKSRIYNVPIYIIVRP